MPPPILLKSHDIENIKYRWMVVLRVSLMLVLVAMRLNPTFWFKISFTVKENFKLSDLKNFLPSDAFQIKRSKLLLSTCVLPLY